ncbi:hypothetical protein C0991_012300 [Blastosporella zonata]|nr:hypothetical protein C0991_012300 [Blastosporella zonata]
MAINSGRFNPTEWIGNGKKYIVGGLPDHVEEAKDQLLVIPALAAQHFPHDSTPIGDFMKAPFPVKLTELITVQTQDCFSKEAPSADMDAFLERPIPSDESISRLSDALGQAWFDGKQSVVDWRTGERLHFWAISYWEEMSVIIHKQKKWKCAQERFESLKRSGTVPQDLTTSIQDILLHYGWNTKLSILRGCRSAELTVFFGNQWLNDKHIDMQVEHLNARINATSDLIGRITVAPAFFAADIETVYKYPTVNATLLLRYEKSVRNGKVKMIYFPANVHANHWIAVYIDIRNAKIGYGDSMVNSTILPPPTEFMKKVLKWVNTTFPGPFRSMIDDLKHGQQKETYNCGIYAPNTIAHAIFGDELLMPNNAKHERLRCLLRCAHTALAAPTSVPLEKLPPAQVVRPDIANLLNPWPNEVVPTQIPADAQRETHVAEVLNDDIPGRVEVLSDKESDEELDKEESAWDSADLLETEPEDVEDDGDIDWEDNKALLDANNDSSGKECHRATLPATKTRPKNGEGKSKSAIWEREARRGLKDGTFSVDPQKQAAYRAKLRDCDPGVKFHPTNVLRARHKCGTWIVASAPYNTCLYRAHAKECKGKPNKNGLAGVPSLEEMAFFQKPSAKKTQKGSAADSPCRGLGSKHHADVEKYLQRLLWGGGGGTAVGALRRKCYPGKEKADLTKEEDGLLEAEQKHTWRWRNDHKQRRVFSTSCKKVGPNGLCSECGGVLRLKQFQTAIWREIPSDENAKYVPRRYQCIALGKLYAKIKGLKALIENSDATNTPYIQYALGITKGQYKKNEVFEGLLRAVLMEQDRDSRGVGFRNFKYAPAWDEHFPVRTARSFRTKVSRMPRFPATICLQSFQLVKQHLSALGYRGMVGLSCDDSKLFSTFCLYWDGKKGKHFLVGSTEGPLEVPDPEAMREVLEHAKKHKATKLRLFCLTLEIPKSSPLIVVAIPIGANLNADRLYSYTLEVICGLIAVGVQVVSYASDGTEVERSVGKLLIENAEWKHTYTIKNPRKGWPDTCPSFIKIDGQPLVVIQDAKHCLKTMRNNLFSGATCLTMGSYIATFNHISTIALETGTPLYRRDVFKLDRQDDNAATRLFSAKTLDFITSHHLEFAAKIVFLFVFGEFGDAIQNRNITHHERLRMVLRTQYFLDRWECLLTACHYPKQKHFLSREALDIIQILLEGYIALMFLHRDSTENTVISFLPWLHSTEACKHVFGQARRIVKDFCMQDFIYMVPKLTVFLRQAALEARLADPKATASGYNHTYLDATNLDMVALATYPDDAEVANIAAGAAADVDSLLWLLGVVPARLNSIRQLQQTKLPSIDVWLHCMGDQEIEREIAEEGDEGMDKEINEVHQLQEVFNAEEAQRLVLSSKGRRALLNIACAASAVTVGEMSRLNEIQEKADELWNKHLKEEQQNIHQHSRQADMLQLPPIRTSLWAEEQNLLGLGQVSHSQLDFSKLVAIRHRNETVQAAEGVRTRKNAVVANDNTSACRALLRRLHDVIREEADQDLAVGTGAERSIRWGILTTNEASGNSANAEVAAKAMAVKAGNLRRANYNYTSAKCPQVLLELLYTARVSEIRPIVLGNYGLIYHGEKVTLARVHSLYAKTGEKNGRHSDVADKANIASLSYLSVQVYKPQEDQPITGSILFTNVTDSTELLQLSEYAHINSYQFLLLMPTIIGLAGGKPLLTGADTDFYSELTCPQVLQSLMAVMKLFCKRPGKRGTEAA